MKKLILKDIIVKLLYNKIKMIKEISNKNKISIDISNNRNKLQKYNSNNNYIHNIYNYNNKNIINNMMINNMVSNILYKYFNSKINNKYINQYKYIKYIISKPIYKNTNDKLNIIIFIYNNYNSNIINNKNNNILLIRMIDNLNKINKNNMNLNEILSKIYNKNVIIEPIILKYDYFNNNIFSKNISNNINIYNTYKKEYSRILNNNITLLDRMSLILNNNKYKNYISNIINNNILLYLTSNNINNNNNIEMLNTGREYLNINNTIWNLLNNKYIIGYSFKFTGKLPKSLSTARKLTYIKYNGSLKHNTLDNLSIKHTLNNYKSNISISSTNNINKNGKFNVNIKLGHI